MIRAVGAVARPLGSQLGAAFSVLGAPRALTSGPVVMRCMSTYAESAFDADLGKALRSPVNPEDVRIRPDGFLYIPEVKYRKLMNDTFGPGGWCLVPMSPAEVNAKGLVVREYALWAQGRYVSQAVGDHMMRDEAQYGIAIESCRSRALTRCCKDLGVASELWDHEFSENWKAEYAEHVTVRNNYSGRTYQMWKMIGMPLDSNLQLVSGDVKDMSPRQSNDYSQRGIHDADDSDDVSLRSSGWEDDNTEFDIDNVVPMYMKKHNGKTWRQVLSEKQGPQYIDWIINSSNADDGVKNQCRKALLAAGDM